MKRVNHHLTEQQIGQLRDLAKKTGLTVAELIRRAVDDYITSFQIDLDNPERKQCRRQS